MTWRITDRTTFTRLRQEGWRERRGPFTVWFLPDDDARQPRLAFAVSRRVGGAVVRNRVKRQLRAVVDELAAGVPGVAPGAYLISVAPAGAHVPYEELQQTVAAILHRLARRAGSQHRGDRR